MAVSHFSPQFQISARAETSHVIATKFQPGGRAEISARAETRPDVIGPLQPRVNPVFSANMILQQRFTNDHDQKIWPMNEMISQSKFYFKNKILSPFQIMSEAWRTNQFIAGNSWPMPVLTAVQIVRFLHWFSNCNNPLVNRYESHSSNVYALKLVILPGYTMGRVRSAFLPASEKLENWSKKVEHHMWGLVTRKTELQIVQSIW